MQTLVGNELINIILHRWDKNFVSLCFIFPDDGVWKCLNKEILMQFESLFASNIPNKTPECFKSFSLPYLHKICTESSPERSQTEKSLWKMLYLHWHI